MPFRHNWPLPCGVNLRLVEQSRTPLPQQVEEHGSCVTLWLMLPQAPDISTLDDLIGRPVWMRLGACVGQDAGDYVSSSAGSPYERQRASARGARSARSAWITR